MTICRADHFDTHVSYGITKMPEQRNTQTFIPATVLLQPGLEADLRKKLVEAFGAEAKETPIKAYLAFEDLMTVLLADWLKSGRPIPKEIIRKWKDVFQLPPAGLESVNRYEAERPMPCERNAETLKHALEMLAQNVRCGSRGGNWNSPLWFCGYEPGGCRSREDGTKYTVLDTDVCSSVDLGFLPDDERFAELNYPYARKLAAFVSNLMGDRNVNSNNEGLKKAITVHRLFSADGIGCDCNLYPVQRPNHNIWDKLGVMYKGVDFGLVEQYKIDKTDTSLAYPSCIEADRKKAWQNQLEKVLSKHPIVIIANGQRDKFEKILCGPKPSPWVEALEDQLGISVRELGLEGNDLCEGLLISMPHFSSHGLSNELLARRAVWIRRYLEDRERSGSFWQQWFQNPFHDSETYGVELKPS